MTIIAIEKKLATREKFAMALMSGEEGGKCRGTFNLIEFYFYCTIKFPMTVSRARTVKRMPMKII